MRERVGCGLCVEACVSGVIQLHPESSIPLLCDLCGGEPDCAKKCPTGALVAVEGRDHAGKRMREKVGIRTEKQLMKTWNAVPCGPWTRPWSRLILKQGSRFTASGLWRKPAAAAEQEEEIASESALSDTGWISRIFL